MCFSWNGPSNLSFRCGWEFFMDVHSHPQMYQMKRPVWVTFTRNTYSTFSLLCKLYVPNVTRWQCRTVGHGDIFIKNMHSKKSLSPHIYSLNTCCFSAFLVFSTNVTQFHDVKPILHLPLFKYVRIGFNRCRGLVME